MFRAPVSCTFKKRGGRGRETGGDRSLRIQILRSWDKRFDEVVNGRLIGEDEMLMDVSWFAFCQVIQDFGGFGEF